MMLFCLRRFANLVTDQGLVAMRNLFHIVVFLCFLPASCSGQLFVAQDGQDPQPLRDPGSQ